MFEPLIPSRQTSANDAATAQLAVREGRALRWTAFARVVFLVLGTAVALHGTGSANEMVALLLLLGVALCVQLVILRALQKVPSGVAIGMLGTITDALVLCALPLIWHMVYTTENEPLTHLSRHNLTAVSLAIIAMNGLALRPIYPAILTGVVVGLHIGLAWLALTDPRLNQFDGGISRALGVGFSELDLIFVTPLFVGLTGILVSLAAGVARATVREAVGREHREHQLRQEQLQAVLGAKIEAVGGLVAGVQHEVNSPLGALRSAADTAEKALERIRSAGAKQDTVGTAQQQRALAAVGGAMALIAQASQRLAEVMTTIRKFAQLDRAEVQILDLSEVLQTALDIQQSSFGADVEVAVDIVDQVMVEGDPRRITEALSTVLRNAAESLDGPGKLAIRLWKEQDKAHIEIQDWGRGLAPESIEQLFEIDFRQGERTHVRFGLPLCRSIIHGHGGTMAMESELGKGTRVKIELPIMTLQQNDKE